MGRLIPIFTFGFLIIIAAIICITVILSYNGLVTSEKNVDAAWAQIEVVCQRRLDLLPNLVETVKGYAAHEKETLTAIIQARTRALSALQAGGSAPTPAVAAKIAETQAQVTSAMRGIFALVENYPNLKASSGFIALQDQLEGTENRISVTRQRYNLAVKTFNAKIEKFPGVILAPLFGFNEKKFFESPDPKALEPVKVQF